MTPFNDGLSITLVNCLHYAVTLLDKDGNKIRTLLPSKHPVKVTEQRDHTTVDFNNVGHVQVCNVRSVAAREPEQIEGVAYIVPLRALQIWAGQNMDTTDMYAPFDLVRDSGGKVIGCKSLMQIGAVQ